MGASDRVGITTTLSLHPPIRIINDPLYGFELVSGKLNIFNFSSSLSHHIVLGVSHPATDCHADPKPRFREAFLITGRIELSLSNEGIFVWMK
jgi:hypothetical protein